MTGFSVSTQEKDLGKFAIALQQLLAGRSNAVGIATLGTGVTSTTIKPPNCAASSFVFLFPATAHAAAVVATTYVPAATIGKQQFVIQHASTALTDVTFFYVCLG